MQTIEERAKSYVEGCELPKYYGDDDSRAE